MCGVCVACVWRVCLGECVRKAVWLCVDKAVWLCGERRCVVVWAVNDCVWLCVWLCVVVDGFVWLVACGCVCPSIVLHKQMQRQQFGISNAAASNSTHAASQG